MLEEAQGIESMGLTISIRCARSTSMHLSHDSGPYLIIPRLDRDSGTDDNLGAGSMSSRSDIGRDDEYAELKRFFEAFSTRYFPKNNLPADRQPLALLAVLEKAGQTAALRQLRQMVTDCIEMARALPEDEAHRFDVELAERGIVGLSTMRRRYSKRYRQILKRGEIRTEDEYRLMWPIADESTDIPKDERALVESMLRAYEEK